MVIQLRNMLAFPLLQDRSPGGTAKSPKVPAVAHMAMVETVAEGQTYAQRHAHRGRDKGTYKTRRETDLFLASNIIIIFRWPYRNFQTYLPYHHVRIFRWGVAKYEVYPLPYFPPPSRMNKFLFESLPIGTQPTPDSRFEAKPTKAVGLWDAARRVTVALISCPRPTRPHRWEPRTLSILSCSVCLLLTAYNSNNGSSWTYWFWSTETGG